MSESIFELCKNGDEEGVRGLIAADRTVINTPDKVADVYIQLTIMLSESLLISHISYVQNKMTPLMHAAKNGKTVIA